jgi:hypothetical protein
MKYTIYNPTTGKILSNIDSTQPPEMSWMLKDMAWIDGEYDNDKYYIDAGNPVEIPVNPSSPNIPCYFDYDTKTWKIDLPALDIKIREYRDVLFMPLDRISPMRYETLSEEQRQELRDYRQALIDITKQNGYPLDVVYPVKPTWL